MQKDLLSRQLAQDNKSPDTSVAVQGTGKPSKNTDNPGNGNIRRPVSYKQALNGNSARRSYFICAKENTVRIDFSDFRTDAHKADEYFGQVFAGVNPVNHKKHTKKPIYEMVFETKEEANKVFSTAVSYNELRMPVHKRVSNKTLLQNVRIQDAPVNKENRELLLEDVTEQFFRYGEVLEVMSSTKDTENIDFWNEPDSNFHLQLALSKDF